MTKWRRCWWERWRRRRRWSPKWVLLQTLNLLSLHSRRPRAFIQSVFTFQKQVQANVCVTMEMVKEALDQLRGAVMIVYPMGLPPHDPIRMEFEDREDLSGTQVNSWTCLSFLAAVDWWPDEHNESIRCWCFSTFEGEAVFTVSLHLVFSPSIPLDLPSPSVSVPSGISAGDHRGRVPAMVGCQRNAEGEKTARLCWQKWKDKACGQNPKGESDSSQTDVKYFCVALCFCH